MEYIPETFYTKLFNMISYEDIMSLIQTPTFRNIVLDYFSTPINFRQLEKNIILGCIENLERDLDIKFSNQLVSFFKKRGYSPLETTLTQDMILIVNEYLDELIRLFEINEDNMFRPSYIESQVKELKKRKTENKIPYDLFDRFAHANVSKFYDFSELSKKYRYILEDIQEESIENHFKKFYYKLFYKKNAYDNTMEYLNEVNKYIATLPSSVSNAFKNCMEKRRKEIRYIFLK